MEKRSQYYFTDQIGQQSTKLLGLLTYSGKYLTYAELIHEIARKLDICISETDQHVFYVSSEEDYDKIFKEFYKVLR